MTILQKPETINLSGNLVDFIISSSSAVSFVLKQGTRVLFEGNYTPNDKQRIEIDVKDIIEADLKAVFSDSSEPYEQSELAKTYTAEIAGQTHTFTVIKAGVDRLATSAANFLKANWLTWQPQVKKVTYYLPESLTFYSVEASVVKVKAYFQQPDGGYSEETKQLLSVVAGKAYTVPVQYAVIAGKFESRLPAFYDVWFETVAGVRLSYIQRYVSSGMMSEDESWIVFENSLGGFDTFRAYGQQSLTADHDHQLAEIGDITDEYNVDTTREFQKNTGYLVEHERKWLLDFFPSRQKYLYSSNYLRRIVVTEDDTSYTGNELPSSYTFNYRFADAKPYLNLQRVEELPSDLTISIPDLSSFTIPPRLVEFPSQNLTEGVMFPVQNPYSESWATTTIGAILSYIMNKIIEVGGDGTGGVGHTHANFDVLKALEYVDEYLTYNGKKIKAGYADEAGKISEENDVYIHKDRIDETSFLLKLLAGVFLGDFVTGIQGGMIDKNGDAELRSIYARKRIFTPEFAYNRVTYIKGKYVVSPGGGCTVDTVTDNGDGTYTIKPDLTDADALSQFPDDILTTYFVTRNEGGVLNGFEEMKFRVVSSDFDAKTFVLTPKPGNNWVPQESMVLAQTGNFTDTERQTYIIFDTVNGNNSITFFDHANTWEPEPAQMPIWIGKKKGMTVAGINADDYPAVLQNILMTGLIFQIDEITGDTVRVPLDKGEWKAGQYGYYNRVSHNGALWLCISEEGTSEEPGTGNAWLKQVAEGAEGKPGLSVVGGGHWEASKAPYAANTMVTLFNCVFISNVETSEPPLAIARFKNGNYRRKPDGGYILAGKSADFIVHPDWTMLLDGRELKGTSITFLGSFATAPSNPVEGNSYYNTTDKCTYVYQNGVWMIMVSDGKDGRDYEWIYTRNNSIGITPDKPDSQQQDDYVPEGWTDDFLGVSEEYQVEWACKRTKKDGVWSEWTDPAPVHRWAKDGTNGQDGISIEAVGHWESSKVPYTKNQLVNFAYGTFIALRETLEPPLAIARFKNGNYRRKPDGGYILAGNSANMTIHSDWQMMTPPDQNASYWLDSPVSSIGISSVGTPSPSSVQVTCRMSIHGTTQLCGLFFLVARKYNGSWLSHVSPVKDCHITVPATSGYTQFAVRAYRTSSDANAWNDNYVCEKGIGVSVDGAQGADAAFLYDNGPWKSGTTYVWNDTRRDKVIHPFDGVYYNFQIKAKGMTVTAAPSSATGDSNWEALGKYISICTDSLFADGANIANFMFKNGVMRSQDETDGVPNTILNGKTGYFHCNNVDITGIVNATGGTFKNVTFQTQDSGDRVIIDATTNSIKLMSGNNLLGNFFFYEIAGYKSAQLYVNNAGSGEMAEFRPGEVVTTSNRVVDMGVSHMIESEMRDSISVRNMTLNNSVYINEKTIQFTEGSNVYTGYTGIVLPTIDLNQVKLLFKNGILYKVTSQYGV